MMAEEKKDELSDFGAGLALVAIAAFILIAPRYLDAPKAVTLATEVVAVLLAVLSVSFILIGGKDSVRPPGVSDIGMAFLFGGTAAVIAVYEQIYDFASPWSGIAKWCVLILGGIAAIGVGMGISKLISTLTIRRAESGHGKARSGRDIQQVLVTVLGTATAIIGLLQALVE
jgi:hypothetical protein